MAESLMSPSSESLRIVIFTNIPGGVVYATVNSVLRPLGHRVVAVVTTPGPAKRRSTSYLDVVAAVPPSVDVIVTNHPERLAAMLTPLEPDLIISGGFPWLIPDSVIALPRLGAINMHPAPLPKYRGPCAIEWMFRNGDPVMGFTVHRLAGEFDTGPILAQGQVAIDDDDDMGNLIDKMDDVIPPLLVQAIERVMRGDPGDPQDETRASYAGMFDPTWRAIDWSRTAREIHNQVRSWTGVRDIPRGAIGEVDGKWLTVQRTRLPLAVKGVAGAGPAGTVLVHEPGRILIQCGDGPLELIDWLPANATSV